MDALHEVAFLAAVLLPVGVVALLNLVLAVTGESGTLLLPSLRRFPTLDLSGVEAAVAAREAAAAAAEAAAEAAEMRKAA